MKFKVLSVLLLLAMSVSLLTFVGCDSNTGSSEPPQGNEATGPTVSRDGLVVIAENGLSNYRIVYPQKMEALKDAAQRVADAISTASGVELPIVQDQAPGANEYEIRIGDVKGSRVEVLSVYSGFGLKNDADFAVSTVGNTVYIYSTSAQGATAGIDYFLEKVVTTDSYGMMAGVAKDMRTIYNKEENATATLTGSDENYVYFSLGAGTLVETFCRLSYTGSNGWRLQTKSRASDSFNDRGAAQLLSYSLGEADPSVLKSLTVEESDGSVTVRSESGAGYVVLTTKGNFALTFYTESGKEASSIVNIVANAGGSTLTGTLQKDEAVFGTGERFNTTNQRGKLINMVSKDIWSAAHASYVTIPLLCLSRGSGIFLNTYQAMDLELGIKAAPDVWTAKMQSANVDCYVFTTEEIEDVVYGYSKLTGFAGEVEEWTYGMLLCRFSPDLSGKWSANITWNEEKYGSSPDGSMTADERGMGVYDVIAKMEEYDLPWTGILAEPWPRYSTASYADLKELCDYVHSLGKKFMVYIGVGGGTTEQGRYLLSMTNPDGSIVTKLPDTQDVESGNPDNNGTDRPYIDITNPAALEWFFEEKWDYLSNEIGVDGCKIDFCELLPEYGTLNYYDTSIPTKGSHHWYPSAFNAMFWEMIDSKPDGGMCYIRGGGIGLQRSPYVWAGDQKREFASLKYQLVATLSSGMSGLPFISYDMSGYEYKGGRAWDEKAASGAFWNDPGRRLGYESQVFIRGLQFSAFTISLQTHGTVRWAFEFAEDGDRVFETVNGVLVPKKDANGNYVYAPVYKLDPSTGAIQKDKNGSVLTVKDENGNTVYATPGTYAYVTDIYRAYVKLHELLTPYISEYAAKASATGTPLMRHLAFYAQDDAKVYTIDDEYMFGDAFLVAPVLDYSNARDIYLPEGTWKDLNTGDVYEIANGVCTKNGVAVESNDEKGYTIENYDVAITELPVFYNMDTNTNTSETAAGLLPGIAEIFAELDAIEQAIPDYLKNVFSAE